MRLVPESLYNDVIKPKTESKQQKVEKSFPDFLKQLLTSNVSTESEKDADRILNSNLPDDVKIVLYQNKIREMYEDRERKRNEPLLVQIKKEKKDEPTIDLSSIPESSPEIPTQPAPALLPRPPNPKKRRLVNRILPEDSMQTSPDAVSRKRTSTFDEDEVIAEKIHKKDTFRRALGTTKVPIIKYSPMEIKITPKVKPHYPNKFSWVPENFDPPNLRKRPKRVTKETLWDDYVNEHHMGKSTKKKHKYAPNNKRSEQFDQHMTLKRMKTLSNTSKSIKRSKVVPDADATGGYMTDAQLRRSGRRVKKIVRWSPYQLG